MIKVALAMAILTLLSGCFCLTDTDDRSDVPEYFSSCWGKFEGKK